MSDPSRPAGPPAVPSRPPKLDGAVRALLARSRAAGGPSTPGRSKQAPQTDNKGESNGAHSRVSSLTSATLVSGGAAELPPAPAPADDTPVDTPLPRTNRSASVSSSTDEPFLSVDPSAVPSAADPSSAAGSSSHTPTGGGGGGGPLDLFANLRIPPEEHETHASSADFGSDDRPSSTAAPVSTRSNAEITAALRTLTGPDVSDSDSDGERSDGSNSDSDDDFFDFDESTIPLTSDDSPSPPVAARPSMSMMLAAPPAIVRSARPSIVAFHSAAKQTHADHLTTPTESAVLVSSDAASVVSVIVLPRANTDDVQIAIDVGSFAVPTSDAAASSAAAIAPVPSPSSSPLPSSSTTFLISQEIFDSERRFVSSMSTLHDVLIAPYETCVVTRDERTMGRTVFDPRVQVFFATATQILKLNRRFLEELRSVMDSWRRLDPTATAPPDAANTIGAVFMHFSSLFKIFSQYARDHEVVSGLLLTAAQVEGSAFAKFVTRMQADARCRGQTLESMLIQPIQRVPRYRLLLEELKRKSAPTDAGYADLISSLSAVADVALHVNETIRHREQNERLKAIEERFVPSSATSFQRLHLRDREPPRHLLREGSLKRLTRRGRELFYFHLFDDCLLYSDEAAVRGQYRLHRRVNFRESVALTDKTTVAAPVVAVAGTGLNDHGNDSDSDVDASSAHTAPTQFAIEIRSPAKSFIVVFPTEEEKDAWLRDLRACVESTRSQLQSSGGEDGSSEFVAPIWAQDQEATQCGRCDQSFTLFNRRHHCRQCGTLVCGLCSRNKRMLPSVDAKKPLRVCDVCIKLQHEATVAARAAGRASVVGTTDKRASIAKPNGISALLAQSGTASPAAAAGGANSTRDRLRPPAANGDVDVSGAAAAAADDESSEANDTIAPLPTPVARTSSHGGDIPPYRRALFTLAHTYRGEERLMNAMELYLSEITYCKELEVLLSEFVTPLLNQISTSKKGLLSTQTQAQLGGRPVPPSLLLFLHSFRPIYTLAMELHKCLHAKIITGDDASSTSASRSTPSNPTGWNPHTTTFGELFLRFAHLFAMYADFAGRHREAIATLTDADHRDVFSKCESQVRDRMGQIHEEQRRMNDAAKKMEVEWSRQDAEAARVAAANTITPLETMTVDIDTLTGASSTAAAAPPSFHRSSSLARPSTGRLSMSSSTFIVLDEPPTHTALIDLLTSPFMRVSKYVWLLSSLLRATPVGHPDNRLPAPVDDGAPIDAANRPLACALAAVQRSLADINSAILAGENVALLTKLQDRFVGSAKEVDIVKPRRALVKEGPLKRQTRSGVSSYYFHCFSDVLLYSEVTVHGKYRIHRRLPLVTMQVLDTGVPLQLEVRSPIKSFVVIAASEAEKDDWLEEVTLAIKSAEKEEVQREEMMNAAAAAAAMHDATAAAGDEESRPHTSHQREASFNTLAPLWVKDSTAEACQICNKKFSFIIRRHHCRACGAICCATCSSGTRVIPTLGSTSPVRVCDRCQSHRDATSGSNSEA